MGRQSAVARRKSERERDVVDDVKLNGLTVNGQPGWYDGVQRGIELNILDGESEILHGDLRAVGPLQPLLEYKGMHRHVVVDLIVVDEVGVNLA